MAKELETSHPILWDAAKAFLRGKIIAKCARLKKIRHKKLSDLQKQLKNLEQRPTTNYDPFLREQMRPVKQEIDKILSEENERKLKFLKQRYYEAGPEASKMLAWRIRKQQAENSIHKMRDPITNKVTTKLEEIQNAFEKY